ncbi:formyl transferase [Clostridium bovifaecis]|uniref:Formyl transferase n=1 Tax=Clostridium bovifaecis TaxID=2184719 RepID=A0A6I6FBB6_9CLOT|nr:formyl transferase [Clostridium bovifaecis]
MKILFLTNNRISHGLYNWLREKGEDVLIFEEKLELDKVKEINPDFIISYNYRYIVKKDIIHFMNNRIINLHISLLPWNRGAHPNVWAFLEETPKGVTIHVLDEGLDTGDILYQKQVYFDEHEETLASSYEKLHSEIQKLFTENWENIKDWNISPISQPQNGTKHFAKEFENVSEKLGLNNDWNINIIKLKNKYKKYKTIN